MLGVNNILPDVHPELTGFNVILSKTGKVEYIGKTVDELNAFLTKYVPDKKFDTQSIIEDIVCKAKAEKPVTYLQQRFVFYNELVITKTKKPAVPKKKFHNSGTNYTMNCIFV